jgi:hypothetical protein
MQAMAVDMACMLTKHHQPTMSNPYAMSDRRPMLFPKDPGNKVDFAYIAELLWSQCHPAQKRCYHKPCSQYQAARYDVHGHKNVYYNYKEPMGQNTIGNFLKELCKLAGIPDWKTKTNHCLRAWAITQLANDPNVNQVETAHAVHHTLTQAQSAYIKATHVSDKARIDALRPIYPRLPSLPPVQVAECPAGALIAANLQVAQGDDWDNFDFGDTTSVKSEGDDDVTKNGFASV